MEKNDLELADHILTWLQFVWRRLAIKAPLCAFDDNLPLREFDDVMDYLDTCQSWTQLIQCVRSRENNNLNAVISHSLLWAIEEFSHGRFRPKQLGRGLATVQDAVNACRQHMRAINKAERIAQT